MRCLAFGGPLNEQMVDVPEGMHTYRAIGATRHREVFDPDRLIEPHKVATTVIEYRMERFAWNGQTWLLLIAPGFPKQRITDQVEAVLALCKMPWAWGGIDGCECRGALYEYSGCIDGLWYGMCEVDHCDGMCEMQGRCPCSCHTIASR